MNRLGIRMQLLQDRFFFVSFTILVTVPFSTHPTPSPITPKFDIGRRRLSSHFLSSCCILNNHPFFEFLKYMIFLL